MKGFAIVPALLCVTSAVMHRIPLQKVPLEDQLSAAKIGRHMSVLKHKYTQKFMAPTEDIFYEQSVNSDPHNVPVENFLNAQCTGHRVTSG
jgi:hypothetical protein